MMINRIDYYNLTNEQKLQMIIVLVIFIMLVLGIYGILYFIKNKYKDRIYNSKSKIIKKFFDGI